MRKMRALADTNVCGCFADRSIYIKKNNLIVAPMAGVTDRPFRELCMRYGAGMAVSE